MSYFEKNAIKSLLSKLCCSFCKNDFDFDSIRVKSKEGEVYSCNLICQKCGKNFGDIVLKYNKSLKIHRPLEIVDGPAPINADDVLDAHNFIKKMK